MSSIVDYVLKLAPQVGKFVLFCIVTVLIVGLIARTVFEDAKKKPSKNDTDPRKPLEPLRRPGPHVAQ
jgi:hypothetical protein